MTRSRRTLHQGLAVDCSLEATIFWLILRYAAEGRENWFFILWRAPSEREWEGRAETRRFFVAMRDVHTACKASTYSAKDLGVKLRERANRIRSLTPER